MTDQQTEKTQRKRSSRRYWIEVKGNVYARLQYKTEGGQYKTKYKPIIDKRTARSVVEEMRRELEDHGEEIFLGYTMTFEMLVRKYEEAELVEATYRESVKIGGRRSIAAVNSALKPLRAYFGRRLIRSIKPFDIRSYKQLRLMTPIETEVNEKTRVLNEKTGRMKTANKKVIRQRHRKISTVNRELSWLRAILNFAISNDWLEKNPFTKMKGIITVASEIERDRILTLAEEERLLAACSGERAHLRPMLICALDTAMRRGEIFKTRWRDVDLDASEIRIPQTNTKTEEARMVGITPRLKRELENLWNSSLQDKDSIVFGVTNTIKRSWKTACDMAGIEDFRFHDCRHTATTRMIASGSPHTEVMKITGHSQMKTFLRYLNMTTRTVNQVASRLENYLTSEILDLRNVSEQVN